jgi:hypothetical protein
MLDAGLTLSDAMTAAEAHEKAMLDAQPKRSKGAERQARYEERKRQKASESVRNDDDDVSSPSLPLSPQTPLSPTHPREDITTRPREKPTDEFEAFWKLYPRKKAKPQALKAYLSARKKTDHATIVAGLTAQISWGVFAEPKFSPHPATWLNAGRWSDERDAEGSAGVAGRQGSGRSGRGSSDLVAIVSKRRADREARMEVSGGEDTLFGEHHNWREGSIEGEYRASDQPYRNGDDARDETER